MIPLKIVILQHDFRHGEMNIVIDNPPFTRVGADNNAIDPDVPTTIFGDRDPDYCGTDETNLYEA